MIQAFISVLLLFAQAPQAPTVPTANAAGTCLVFQRLKVEAGLLELAHLSPNDEENAANTIAEFFRTFRAYGMALDRGIVTRREFILMRDSLVAQTLANLQSRLTADGWKRLNHFITDQILRPTAPPRRVPNPKVIET